MTTEEFTDTLDEIKTDLRDLWESALEARNAANNVLDKRMALDMKLTKMQTKALQAEHDELTKG